MLFSRELQSVEKRKNNRIYTCIKIHISTYLTNCFSTDSSISLKRSMSIWVEFAKFRGSPAISWVSIIVGANFRGSQLSWVPIFVGHFSWVVFRGSIFVGHFSWVNFLLPKFFCANFFFPNFFVPKFFSL